MIDLLTGQVLRKNRPRKVLQLIYSYSVVQCNLCSYMIGIRSPVAENSSDVPQLGNFQICCENFAYFVKRE